MVDRRPKVDVQYQNLTQVGAWLASLLEKPILWLTSRHRLVNSVVSARLDAKHALEAWARVVQMDADRVHVSWSRGPLITLNGPTAEWYQGKRITAEGRVSLFVPTDNLLLRPDAQSMELEYIMSHLSRGLRDSVVREVYKAVNTLRAGTHGTNSK